MNEIAAEQCDTLTKTETFLVDKVTIFAPVCPFSIKLIVIGAFSQ